MTHLQRVFLSTTAVDLGPYHTQVREEIARVGAVPLFVEDALSTDTLQRRYDHIQEADVFVGIYAHSYGAVPGSEVVYRKADHTTAAGDNETSVIHWEYLWACERGLPILLFMINPNEDTNQRTDEAQDHRESPADKARLVAFKRLIANKHAVSFFLSLEHLVRQVQVELAAVLPSSTTSAQRFKGYELHNVIATGGYGIVYRAQQTAVDREVAIKLIRPEHTNHPDFIRSFEAEAKLIARLEHPYIVPLFDYWRDADSTCLVMRYMRGGSISQCMTGQPLALEDVLRWVEQIGAALAYAHRNGVIHRDLKPDNLLLDEEGNTYLSDFGIARATGYRSTDKSIIGTLAYIAPDQLKSEPPTPQADLYSLGILLYELLTGTHPFAGQSPSELIMSHLATPLPAITLLQPQLSPAVQAVIDRATAKAPDQRYPDARAMVEAFRRAIQHGQTPDGSVTSESVELNNPYKGLRAFQEYDAGDFFGRDALVTQFIERMRQENTGRLLAVVGPSGSGKSSAVRAGLLPALRRGALSGSENWFITEMLPGSQPFEELEAALLRVAIKPSADLSDQLKASEHGLINVLKDILPQDHTELLLVIDQFEELFTLTNNEAERVHFLNSLLMALNDPESRLRIVLTLRADFYDKPLYYLDFGTQLKRRVETVLPLSTTELEQSIVRPAERAGAVLEKGLVAAILQEIGEQPGILPLLQYALTDLFERRQGKTLTFEAYRAMGGVTGALGQHAEALYSELDEAGQEVARQVFLRLITLGEGTEDTRRRVRQTEFEAAASTVIHRFGVARLLTFDRDPQTRGPTVEVAHEALLRTWQRLKDWIAAVRDELAIHRRLSQAAEEWIKANQDSGFLAVEAPLEQFENWSHMTTLRLNDVEQTFLEASLVARENRQALDQARKAHEARTAQRAQNLGRAAALFAVTGLLAIVLTAFAFVRTNQLEEIAATISAGIIEANATATQITGELGGQKEHLVNLSLVDAARRALTVGDRPLAVHLALLAAMRPNMKYPPDLVVEQGVHEVMYSLGQRKTLASLDFFIDVMAFNPQKGLIAIGLRDGSIEVRDGATGTLKLSIVSETTAQLNALVFNQEGTKLAYAFENKTLWLLDLDSETPRPVELLPASTPYNAYAIAFSPDGKYLVTGSADTHVRLLDATTGAELSVQTTFDPNDPTKGQKEIFAIAFTPDGKHVISGGYEGPYALSLWNIENEGMSKATLVHDRFWTTDTNVIRVTSIAVSQDPDGKPKIATASEENIGMVIRLWDLETGTSSDPGKGHTGTILSMAFSQDGQYLVSGSFDTSLRLWDVTTLSPRAIGDALIGHLGGVTGVAFNVGDQSVISTAFDRTIRVWDVTIPQSAGAPWPGTNGSWLWSVATSPDGKYVVTGAEDGTMQLWDASSRQSLAATRLPARVYSLAFNPLMVQQGSHPTVAIGMRDGRAYLWDIDGQDSTLAYIVSEEQAIYSVSYSSDGQYLAIGSGNIDGRQVKGVVRIWDVANRTTLHYLTADAAVRTVAISPPGVCPGGTTCIAAGAQDGFLYMWDLATGQPLIEPVRQHADVILSLAFSPAGKCGASAAQPGTCLITGSADRSINMWTLTGNLIGAPWIGHKYWVNSVAFSPDGRYVVSASADKTLRVWDAATHTPIGQPWIGHVDSVNMVAFMPDGHHVMSVSQDSTLRQWAIRTLPELIDWACVNRYASYLSSEELTSYGVEEDISPVACAAIEAQPPLELEEMPAATQDEQTS